MNFRIKKLYMSDSIKNLLTRGVEEIHVREHLESALKAGRKLRVKHGIDPTGANLHLGHAATLWKLREFQDLGHQVVIIIGDYTAQIGDPTDKLTKRPFLSEKQVAENMKSYQDQLGKILDAPHVEFRYNSEWYSKLSIRELDELAELFTVQQMVSRRNFQERWDQEQEISLRELHYPLYQGYDSVAVRSDIEVGGSDQLFNLLAGRKIQEAYHQMPQDAMTTQMLLGLDGEKMSKTFGNVVNITDTAQDMYGKLMALHDELIPDYFWLVGRVSSEKVQSVKQALKKGVNPRDLKMELARLVTAMYHGVEAAEAAEAYFVKTFQKKEIPPEMPTCTLDPKPYTLVDLLVATKIAPSKAEGRRLILQGGVKIDGVIKKDPDEVIKLSPSGLVLQKGKRVFVRVLSQ